jgi:hypothetical protein
MFLCRTRLRNSDYVVVLEGQVLRLLSHSSSGGARIIREPGQNFNRKFTCDIILK